MSSPTHLLSTASSAVVSPTSTSRATPQGGILEGGNPSHYDPKNPIVVFIIQVAIIVIFCRLLHYPLSKIRQPRVIAEVIGGILLGPSVMGRIPGFTNAIFPSASMANLNNTANLGLVLFLFLVGLEADMRLLMSNWRVALGVGAAGMILPFGLGCGIAYGLYNEFRAEPGTVPIGFGVYMLFIGVAMAITAFPVLCRILTELKLLSTPVGMIVLSAGVGNDVTGWILLALCVALVNAGSGISALWVFLTCVGYVLFLVYPIRLSFRWFLIRTGNLQNGPSQGVIAMTLLMVLISAWFTQVIGVHAIFGGFLIGLICPHDGGFAIKLTEKIEDLVTVLFLPLYFALSGLNTNLGLLDNGITWAYVFGVMAIAFFGKIIGGTLAARASKLVWRESLTIGVLMSCKGLVELIVLNIGLQARILSTRTFTIFVVMALATTFATTPLTTALYPPWYQKKLEAWKRGEIDWDGNKLAGDEDGNSKDGVAVQKLQKTQIHRLLVYLRLDILPSLFTFISLLGGRDGENVVPKVHPLKAPSETNENNKEASTDGQASLVARSKRPLEVHGLRMIELTERTSSVMQVSEIDDVRDPIVNVFHTFGHLHQVAVSGEVAVVPEDSYAETLVGKASDRSSDMLLLPWSENGNISEAGDSLMAGIINNPAGGGAYQHFVMDTLTHSTCNTAILFNRGFGGRNRNNNEERPKLRHTISGISLRSSHRDAIPTAPITDRSHHIFMPFFGGVDDRVALRFVLQLAHNSNVTATVLYVNISPSTDTTQDSTHPPEEQGEDRSFFTSLSDSLAPNIEPRVLFDTLIPADRRPIKEILLERIKSEVGRSVLNAGDLIVVGRRHSYPPNSLQTASGTPNAMARASPEGNGVSHVSHSTGASHSSTGGTGQPQGLGEVAEVMLASGVRGSVLVIQAPGAADVAAVATGSTIAVTNGNGS
ncbi:MAG: K(+)/H(+) antiporter [Peltula sp. TS41687]|nr:MAG: K(+)/H(+) antiporter [Peltula sp. TS41687]